MEIDWQTLKEEALDAAQRAYAPYSDFPVGAAALTDKGTIVSGCNVENASFGLTLCAECGLVSDLIRSGASKLVAIVVVTADGQPCSPCGRCRQLLVEHAAPGCLIASLTDDDGTPTEVSKLLPHSFDGTRMGRS